MHTTALVVETNNLIALDRRDAVATLERLFLTLRDHACPLRAVEELVLTHTDLDAAARERLDRAAGRAVRFVEVDASTGYYAAKVAGFQATTADVVAFGDSDCEPSPTWLDALLAPFARPTVQAVAGLTTYPQTLVGTAATAVDFPYFRGREPGSVRNFYANNVAFRREVFQQFGYVPRPGTYRGHCQVVAMDLWRAGIPIEHAKAAHTVHHLDDDIVELVRHRLLRGSDTTRIAHEVLETYGGAARGLARYRRVSVAAVLLGWYGVSQHRLTTQHVELRGLRRAAAHGLVAGFNTADTAGALLGLMGVDLGVADGSTRREMQEAA